MLPFWENINYENTADRAFDAMSMTLHFNKVFALVKHALYSRVIAERIINFMPSVQSCFYPNMSSAMLIKTTRHWGNHFLWNSDIANHSVYKSSFSIPPLFLDIILHPTMPFPILILFQKFVKDCHFIFHTFHFTFIISHPLLIFF